jgi:hypothetical protein
MPNCSWHAVDEVMVVVAAQRIEAGSELSIGYTNASVPVAARTAQLKNYGFACTCRLCQADRSLDAATRRTTPLSASTVYYNGNLQVAIGFFQFRICQPGDGELMLGSAKAWYLTLAGRPLLVAVLLTGVRPVLVPAR